MIDLKKLQKQIYDNKVKKGFNVTNVHQEFCLVYEETAEAYRAYDRKLPDLGEELADVMIYLMGIAEILKIDMEDELIKKIDKNEKRQYQKINGIIRKID